MNTHPRYPARPSVKNEPIRLRGQFSALAQIDAANNPAFNWRLPVVIALLAYIALQGMPGLNIVGGPKASKLYVVTIDDHNARGTDLKAAELLTDLEFWSKWETDGNNRRHLNSNHPEAVAPYVGYMTTHGLPLLLVMSNDPDTKGRVLWQGRLPSDRGPPGVEEILKSCIK